MSRIADSLHRSAATRPVAGVHRLAVLCALGVISAVLGLVVGAAAPAGAASRPAAPPRVAQPVVNQVETRCYYDVEQTGLPGNVVAVACVGANAAQVGACSFTYEVELDNDPDSGVTGCEPLALDPVPAGLDARAWTSCVVSTFTELVAEDVSVADAESICTATTGGTASGSPSHGSSGGASAGTGAPATSSLTGTWSSNYGPTTLSQSGNAITGTITYASTSGSAQLSGTYDSGSGSVRFTYQNSFGDSGSGQLALSRDGCTLSGSFQSSIDPRTAGPLTLTRTQHCGESAGVAGTEAAQGCPDLSGDWYEASARAGTQYQSTSIAQNGCALRFTNEYGNSSAGYFLDATTVVATDWGNLHGQLSGSGGYYSYITWANDTAWGRAGD